MSLSNIEIDMKIKSLKITMLEELKSKLHLIGRDKNLKENDFVSLVSNNEKVNIILSNMDKDELETVLANLLLTDTLKVLLGGMYG